jgi:hypothetical protein
MPRVLLNRRSVGIDDNSARYADAIGLNATWHGRGGAIGLCRAGLGFDWQGYSDQNNVIE